MSASMAEVLAAHREVHYDSGDLQGNYTIKCKCGHSELNPGIPADEWRTAHQAAALAAAGYGKLEDAKAPAWDEEWAHYKINHRERMMICKLCGAEVPFGRTNEHSRRHK